MFQSNIKKIIEDSINTKVQILQDEDLINTINEVAEILIHAFKHHHKVFFCGNGGSAADAQHLAAELSGRFYKDRPALYSEAFHSNTSFVTAVANDYGFDQVYARAVDAFMSSGDILIGLSTSGNSMNVYHAFEKARSKNITCILFTGKSKGKLGNISDIAIQVPSYDTPRIQESHITIGHIICELVEKTLFS